MSNEPNNTDPLAYFTKAIATQLADILEERFTSNFLYVPTFQPPDLSMVEAGKKFFTVDELAFRWHLSKQRIYATPENELPPVYVGPNRGKKLYRAIDVYRYEDSISQTQYDHAIQTSIEPILENPETKITRLRRHRRTNDLHKTKKNS